MSRHANPLPGSGGNTKRERLHAEGLAAKPTEHKLDSSTPWRASFARLRAKFRRSAPPAVLLRQPVAPSVVLACEQCGFDYSVTRIELSGGKEAAIWSCECGSRYIPPGGVSTSEYVRP